MVGTTQIAGEAAGENISEEKFRLAVEACPTAMVMTDGDGRIALINAETERLFGFKREELIGQSIEMLVPDRVRDRHRYHRDKYALQPRIRRIGERRELSARRRDGSEFPVEIALNPIRTGDDLLVLSVIFDFSERKRIERLKDEFVSTVSHELRTPLTSIAGSLGLLSGGAGGALPTAAAHLIDIAHNNSQRLVRLINDILDVEKIESGHTVFKFRRLAVRPLLEQMIEGSRGYAESFQVQVLLDRAEVAGEVYVDADRLAQIVTNLLSNAIKFSPRNGEILVRVEQSDEKVRIAVRDHGPGIPHEFRPRIFEKFAQADGSDTRQKGGTGLGLSIVKQIVTRLGGTVGYDDAVGGGTIFHLDLPSESQIASRAIDATADGALARVLLLEDDPGLGLAVRDRLRMAGLSTDFAYSTAELCQRAQSANYAAIVVDLDIPDGGGNQLVHRVREQPQFYKTPIVTISSDPRSSESRADAEGLNIIERLNKPPDLEHLTQVLDRVAVPRASHRPKILHVNDERDVLEMVAQALKSTATVISADSIESARSALETCDFDLAILDVVAGTKSGLELLPDLRSGNGRTVPVIIFSAHLNEIKGDLQVKESLPKAAVASLDELLRVVRDRLRPNAASGAEAAL
jgi:PAS domain S-box-containing protein